MLLRNADRPAPFEGKTITDVLAHEERERLRDIGKARFLLIEEPASARARNGSDS